MPSEGHRIRYAFLLYSRPKAEFREFFTTITNNIEPNLIILLWMFSVQPGKKYRDIGKIIQKHANANGFSVVRSFCGHGINKFVQKNFILLFLNLINFRTFHTVPTVPHYAGNKTMGVMKAGHTFTIEPMINIGVHDTMMW